MTANAEYVHEGEHPIEHYATGEYALLSKPMADDCLIKKDTV